MSLWFTSDLHFGHEKIAVIRGFETTEEHDSAIAENWKQAVKTDDHVWVLGDLQMTRVAYALNLIQELPGIKHLIAGNHDPCHPMHREAHRHQRRYLQAFESVQAFARKRICGQTVMLSHFPYCGDHTEQERYVQYRLRNEGEWLLHGHTHSYIQQVGRQIHVGLDAWGMKLVHHTAIENLMRAND